MCCDISRYAVEHDVVVFVGVYKSGFQLENYLEFGSVRFWVIHLTNEFSFPLIIVCLESMTMLFFEPPQLP